MAELPIDQVICGDCVEVIPQRIPDKSINLVMFSPPYWGLRNYGVEGQLGLEPTYQEYVAHLVEVGREVRRVLRGDGSWYLNLGDTYAGSWGNYGNRPELTGIEGTQRERTTEFYERKDAPDTKTWPVQRNVDVPPKCKLLIPYRVALALVDDGWICRNDIVWFKPNAMPSSVKDRLTCQTERVFHLVKSRRYYYDLNAIREPHSTATIKRITQPTIMKQKGGFKQDELNPLGSGKSNFNRPAEIAKSLAKKFNLRVRDVKRGKFGTTAQGGKLRASEKEIENYRYPETNEGYVHPLGKNPGDVIKIGRHHGSSLTQGRATYYEGQHIESSSLGKNPGDIIKAAHIKGDNPRDYDRFKLHGFGGVPPHPLGTNPGDFWPYPTVSSDDYWCPNCNNFVKQKDTKCVRCGTKVVAHFAVYPEALCERPIKSSCPPGGIVLDPMCGSGTTLVVAKRLGRHFIGIDLNPDYCGMAKRRLSRVETPLTEWS